MTDRQIADITDYIGNHREELETEYRAVLREAEEIRQYWEERNREHLARIASMPPRRGYEKAWAKLQAAKAELGMT